MRLAAVIAFSMAASACASTNQILSSEPDEVFHTTASVDEVAACFASRNHLRVIERSDGAKVARIRDGYGGVVQAYSIYPEGSGARIEVRHSAFGMPGVRWKRCVGLQPMKP